VGIRKPIPGLVEICVAFIGVAIIEKVKASEPPFYRPKYSEPESDAVHEGVIALMKQCWAEEPTDRPSFDDVIKTLKVINKGK